tara:strand:- start:406 stop:978 length:573 start_codon:yes stop_codon:yes gene_type:complete
MMLRLSLALLATLSLSACRLGQPSQMVLSYSAYTGRPVVLTEMSVNGTAMAMIPAVVNGRADTSKPRVGSLNQLLGYPAGKAGEMQLDMTWVELPSGAAYHAVVQVALKDLQRSSNGVEFMPVFGPGGLLIIASDPVPKGPGDKITRDVLRTCATRTPDADRDYAATPRELPALSEALDMVDPSPATSTC